MPRNLYSARAKFVWGYQKMKALNADMTAYVERNPHEITPVSDAAHMSLALIVSVLEEIPALRWGMEFGECIQAFRSSLDHAICEIASIREGVWPRPSSQEHILQFPICDTPDAFKKSIWRLGNVLRKDAAVVRRIEGLQPYNQYPSLNRPLLTLLRELNDRDKHRLITIVRGAIPQMTFNINNGTGERLYTLPELHPGPIEDSTPIVIFRFMTPQPEVQMTGSPDFTFYPALPYQVSLQAHANQAIDLVDVRNLLRAFRRVARYCLTGLHLLIS
jgi:hypothetical protein